jgi:type IV/VI secretion system ImpK/VasF family protein
MTSRNLWFSIEETMRRVTHLAVEARAAALVAAHRNGAAKIIASIAKGGAEVVASEALGSSPLDEEALKLARDKSFYEGRGVRQDIVALREQVRGLFQDLRATLAETLSEFDTYSTLFPLVVFCDELVATATVGASRRWETLQGELFETEDGGEKFYSVLEARLHQDETHPLVLQTFYYCLSAGFCGMYSSASSLRAEIQSRLAARIALPELKYPAKAREVGVAEVARFPWLYYGVAAGAVLAVFVLLSWRAG